MRNLSLALFLLPPAPKPREKRCFRTANVTAWPVNNLRETSSDLPPPAPPGASSCSHMDRMPALCAVHWEKSKHVAWGSPDDCLGMMISTICSGCLQLPETPRCILLLAIRGIPNETSAAVQLSTNIRCVWIIFPPGVGGRSTLFNSLIWTTAQLVHNHGVQSCRIISICILMAAVVLARVPSLSDSQCPGWLFPG